MEEGIGLLIDIDGGRPVSSEPSKSKSQNNNHHFLDDEDDTFLLLSLDAKRRSIEAGIKIEREINQSFGFGDAANALGNPEVSSRKSDEATSSLAQSLNCPVDLLVPVDNDDVAAGLDWNLIEAEIQTITSQMSNLEESPQKVLSLSPLKGIPIYESSPESVRGSPKKTPRKAAECKNPAKSDIGSLKQALEKVKVTVTTAGQPSKKPSESPTVGGRNPLFRRSGSLPMRGKNMPRKSEGPSKSSTSLQRSETKASKEAKEETGSCKTASRPPAPSVKPALPAGKAPVRLAVSRRNDSNSRNSSTNSSVNSSIGSARSLPATRKGPLKATNPIVTNVRNASALGLSSSDSSDMSKSSVSTPTPGRAPAAASTPTLAGRNSPASGKHRQLEVSKLRTPSKLPTSLTSSFTSPIPVVPKFQLEREASLPLAGNIKKMSPLKSSNVLSARNPSETAVPKVVPKLPQFRKPMFTRPIKAEKENIPSTK